MGSIPTSHPRKLYKSLFKSSFGLAGIELWYTFGMKIKYLYYVSFWFGVVYLAAKLLAIPGMIYLYSAQGVGWSSFTYIIATNSLLSNTVYFGSIVSGIVTGLLMLTISLSLIRGKVEANKMTKVAVGMLTISLFAVVASIVFAVSTLIFSNSIQSALSLSNQISNVSYPVLPLFFLVSVVLLGAGYIEERSKSNSFKDIGVILTAVALLVIVLVDILKFLPRL